MDVRAIVRRADRFQRRHPTIAVPYAVVKHFGEDGAGHLAATMAYFGFFSLFPLLLVLVTGAALVLDSDPDLQERLLDSALANFPVLGDDIRGNIGQIEGSGVALAIGIATSLWAGLGGIRATRFALDSVWGVPFVRRPSTPRTVLQAFVVLGAFGVFLLAGAILAGVAGGIGTTPLGMLTLAGSAVLNVALFLVMFRILTTADIAWRAVAPGAVVAGIGWTVLVSLGGWIVTDRLASASNTYGSFAVVIGMLVWLHLGAQLTLFGAEVNVVLRGHLWPRSLDGRDITDADRQALRRFVERERRREDEIVEVRFDEPAQNVDEKAVDEKNVAEMTTAPGGTRSGSRRGRASDPPT